MDADQQKDQLPKYTWWVLGLAAVLLLALTVGAIGFISAGFFDPQPVGELTAELTLKPQYIPAQTENIQWQNERPPADDFSLRLTAAYQYGDLDAGYGLALGSDESALVVAVSPTGYVTILQADTPILNWQPWPHVQQGTETNEIWLDKRGDTVTIYINREHLWTGPITPPPSPQFGFYTISFNNPTTINFKSISIFSDLTSLEIR